MVIPNHHVTTDGGTCFPPEFDIPNAFIAYMPNEHREQMVFVQEPGKVAMLYHGDHAWVGVAVQDGEAQMKVHECERVFIQACWLASRSYAAVKR